MRDYEFEKKLNAFQNLSFIGFILAMFVVLTTKVVIIGIVCMSLAIFCVIAMAAIEYALGFEWYIEDYEDEK